MRNKIMLQSIISHLGTKEKLGPGGSGPSHKKNNLAKLQG